MVKLSSFPVYWGANLPYLTAWQCGKILFFFVIFIYFYVHWSFACVRVLLVRSPGTVVTDRCEPPCTHWELNPGPLEEQSCLHAPEVKLFKEVIKYQKWQLMPVISVFQGLRQMDCHEFEVSFDYIMSSRPAWAVEWDPVSERKTTWLERWLSS